MKRDKAVIGEELERSGRYILATNVPSESGGPTDDEMLAQYKGRHAIERGIPVPEPLFFASNLFVKTPRQVAAIARAMGLCLLVYALGKRSLRVAEEGNIRHQRGKPTQKPTLRCVFQLFQVVHLLNVDGIEQISNLLRGAKNDPAFLGRGYS